jgi:hypothetical protein
LHAVACRDTKRAADAVKDIQLSSGNVNVESMQLDLGDLASIRQFAKDYEVRIANGRDNSSTQKPALGYPLLLETDSPILIASNDRPKSIL